MQRPESESALRTLAFAFGVSLACALIVATVVTWLRPMQAAVAALDQARAVLEAAGVVGRQERLDDRATVERFQGFEVRMVDLANLALIVPSDPSAYDYRARIKPGDPELPRAMPVYLQRAGEGVTLLVLPFYGAGMWSTIHGFVALADDFSTVAGLAIYEHGETPGIGDRIQDPEWLDGWRGKRLYDEGGRFLLHVDSQPPPERRPFAVDAITGATVTVQAVERAMVRWFGDEGYGPWLAELREQQR